MGSSPSFNNYQLKVDLTSPKPVIFKHRQFCPQVDICHCLKTFLVVSTGVCVGGGHGVLLSSGGKKPEMLVNILPHTTP